MKKRFIIGFIIITLFFTCSIPTVSKADDSSWVSNAFSAASNFLSGSGGELTVADDSIAYKIYTFVTNIVKAINKVLLVLLAGLSIVSLAIVGVRYIMSGALPSERRKAIDQLHMVFTGMLYGFGAFMIWNIAMSIVKIILKAM